MKAVNSICWILAVCVCLSEARYKIRRPLLPQAQRPPQLYKKPWPISHRMSMGNTLHIGGNFGQKRPHYKPANFRIRRPPMYNVLPTTWKTQQVPVLGVINNHAVLPQRAQVKEFHSMNKVPEYSPEYRPEAVIMPPTHLGGMDDDKGAIHTIPAPNLSLADKPYNFVESNGPDQNPVDQVSHNQYQNDGQYNSKLPGTVVTNYGFGTLMTSVAPGRPVTSPTQNLYEVTEANEIIPNDYHTAKLNFFTPEFDATRLATLQNSDLQTNELFLNHPGGVNNLKSGPIGTSLQFGQSNTPMQTNLHSSLHVGFPGTASQAQSSLGQQIPDLHVGHPAAAGPPLSATQLYDLLNSFPPQVNEQYTNGQQPQLQQHILQQQLSQLFTPTGGVTGFSQPQMHSFNYDEQANKKAQRQQQQQKQQQILVGQDYASGRVTADYTLDPEVAGNVPSSNTHADNINNKEVGYRASEASDQAENHIEYEESGNQKGQNTYFNQVGGEDSIATQFYTTLPNKDTAEKLAALAAAGNVNSHLIGQLRKQQQKQQQQLQEKEQQEDLEQSDQPVPLNHKGGEYEVNEQQVEDLPYDLQEQQQHYNDQQQRQYDDQQQRYDEQQEQYDQQQYQRQHYRQQQIRHQQEINDQYEQQRVTNQQESQDAHLKANIKRPMRIMVPDVEGYNEDHNTSQPTLSAETESTSEDYDYVNPEAEITNTRTTSSSDSKTTYEKNPNTGFGTRLTAKKGQ